MYVILGSTGHIGSVVARKLLEHGKHVRAIARDASRLQTLKEILQRRRDRHALSAAGFTANEYQLAALQINVLPGERGDIA